MAEVDLHSRAQLDEPVLHHILHMAVVRFLNHIPLSSEEPLHLAFPQLFQDTVLETGVVFVIVIETDQHQVHDHIYFNRMHWREWR